MSTKTLHLYEAEILYYGKDILDSYGMNKEKELMQHGLTSVYQHSINVAYLALKIDATFHLNSQRSTLVRGCLLHDYFLYDWREGEVSRRDHGFDHARRALENACRDFSLTDVACDVIEKHMFPLNIRLPKYKESFVVSVADKICATKEVCRFVSQKVGKSVKRPLNYMRERRVPTFE